jgi:hypothetical protein
MQSEIQRNHTVAMVRRHPGKKYLKKENKLCEWLFGLFAFKRLTFVSTERKQIAF